ncbi:hypothetical protein G6F57_020182 [Rhizopus arrhizus]|nr:hypothetical protein G6F57_020182 [Rhizopus arrhizus]
MGHGDRVRRGYQPGHRPADDASGPMAGQPGRSAHRAGSPGTAGHLRHPCRVPDRHPPGFRQRHRADLGHAAHPDLGAGHAAGRLQPPGHDNAAGLRRQLRLHPAYQRAAEHGVPGHGNLQRQAVRQSRHHRHHRGLPADAGDGRDVLALARLALRSTHHETLHCPSQ